MQEAPAFSNDGRFMYLRTDFDAWRPVAWDLQTLDPVGYQRIGFSGTSRDWVRDQNQYPGSDRPVGAIGKLFGNMAYSPARLRHYAVLAAEHGAQRFQIGGFSEETDQWLESLSFPFSNSPRDLQVSADGRRLLVNVTPMNRFETRLVIYDLP